ncbi:MAG: ATP-binding cassette domain-containing protein [Bacteroidales bacterium]|nr:ATP-binding cassette domain-containing protein [Bacteroidales bacterium]
MELFNAIGIEKRYANHLALNNVSIHVPKGSIYGLLGPNGAGKTTLIRIINQITAPDKGELIYNGRKFKAEDIYNIGYLPEERGLYKKMKVGEQALYLARLKGIPKQEAMKRLHYWFNKFEMQAWWNKKVEELSKGMQQKVQFIVTILHEPGLLIFDEPFSGFDPINTRLLKQEILNLRDKGATVIFSTHNMESVEELCDHITLINKSETLLEGKINDIRQEYKSNIFEIQYIGLPENLEHAINNSFEVLENKSEREINLAKIKIDDKKSSNELLSKLIPHVQIKSFKELIPGMNEIFIKAVEAS